MVIVLTSFNHNQKILHFVELKTDSDRKIPFFYTLDYVIKKCLPSPNSLEKRFIGFSKDKEKNRLKFIDNKRFKNNKTGEIIPIKKKTLLEELTQQYSTTQFALQQLDHENKDKELIFLTLTLPPRYHAHINKHKNIRYGIGTMTEGYQILNEAQRQIQKTFSKYKIEYKFIKVIEPHKDFTPHEHIQYWVSNKKLAMQIIKNIVKNRIKKDLLGKQYDMVDLKREEGKNVSGYITKYMTKLISDLGENTELLHKFDGWKRMNKIRMFSNSNTTLPKSIYNTIVSVVPDNFDKKKYENLGVYSLNHIRYISVIDNRTKIKHNPKKDTLFTFRMVKETYKAPNVSSRENPILYYRLLSQLIFGSIAPYEILTRYRRVHLQVFNENNVMIRNSKDWSIIEIIDEEEIIPQTQGHDFGIYDSKMWGGIVVNNDTYIPEEIFQEEYG